MDTNWRAGLSQDSRDKIVTKVMETLQKHTPSFGQDSMPELRKIANRFEERIYLSASNQNEYLKKISLRMLNLETKTQNISGGGPLTISTDTNQISTRTLEPGTQQLQFRQQVVPCSQAGVMNSAMQVSATGHSSNFSNISSISQEAPVLNLAALHGAPSATNASGGQASAQNLHVQSALQANQQRTVQLQNARQQQQQPQQQQSQPSQQQASQRVIAANLGHQQGTGVPQQQLFLAQQLQQSQSIPQQQQQQLPQQQQQQQLPQPHQQHLQQPPQQQQSQPPPPIQQQPQMLQQQSNLLLHHSLHPQQQHPLLKQHQALQQQPQVLMQQRQPQAQGMQQQPVSVLQPLQFAQSLSGHNNTQSSQTLQQQPQAKAVLQQQHQQPQVQSQLPTAGLSQVQQQQQAPALAGLIPQSHLQLPHSQQPQSQAPLLLPTSGAQPTLLSQVQASQPSQVQQQAQQQDQAQRLGQASSVLQQINMQGLREGGAKGSSEALQQIGQVRVIDESDMAWSKMQTMREKYLEDMKELHYILASRSRQLRPQEQLQKLNHYKNVLEQMMPYLSAARETLPRQLLKQDKVEAFEKKIVSMLETFKRPRLAPGQQSQQQPNTTVGQAQTVQQPQQAPQNLQPDGKTVHVPQMNSSLSTSSDLQPSNSSNSSFPVLQSNVSSLQQAIGVTGHSTSLSNLTGTGTSSLHPNNKASFAQNSINPLQMNGSGMQPQQQDQHFHQNRLLKDPEQSRQFQILQLQQQQQQQHMQKQQAQLLQVQQSQLQPLLADANADSKMAKQALVKQMLLNQSQQRNLLLLQQQQQQQKGSLQTVASPQMSPASQLSPQSDLKNGTNPVLLIPKVGTPLQASTPPFMAPSPSPLVEDSEMKPSTSAVPVVTPAVGQVSHPVVATSSGPLAAIGNPGLSVSPLLGDYTSSPQITSLQDQVQTYIAGCTDEGQILTEPPLKRLVRAINSMSPQALEASISDMQLLINLAEKLGGSAPGAQSRAAVGEDLAQVTKCRAQARIFSTPDGGAIAKKVKRRVDSLALSLISSDGNVTNSVLKINSRDSETESVATSSIKFSYFETELLEEIDRINDRLIGTRVEVDAQGNNETAAEGKDGISVRCMYALTAVKHAPKSPLYIAFPPLRLRIPPQYPNCSPIIQEGESAPNASNSLACEAWDGFKRAARCLPQPFLLGDIVKAWDSSAYNAILDVAIRQGGGNFSSRYGNWINSAFP